MNKRSFLTSIASIATAVALECFGLEKPKVGPSSFLDDEWQYVPTPPLTEDTLDELYRRIVAEELCKDCKWCFTPKILFMVSLPSLSECRRPSWTLEDLVTGERKKTFCSNQRDLKFHGLCGPDAKFFEPKA